jgi:hypothetical protein
MILIPRLRAAARTLTRRTDGLLNARDVDPGNKFEADLVYLLAWQLWRFGRLIRHETGLMTENIHEPPESMFDFGRSTVTKEAILDAIARLECERQNGNSRRNGQSHKKLQSSSYQRSIKRCEPLSWKPNARREIADSRI